MLVESADWNSKSTAQLKEGLDLLDDRSRDILTSRWLGEEKQTLHQLADKYGISAERIRQLEANAIRKLRGMLVS
jgi:RNA polymerase sigma-32 factor